MKRRVSKKAIYRKLPIAEKETWWNYRRWPWSFALMEELVSFYNCSLGCDGYTRYSMFEEGRFLTKVKWYHGILLSSL